MPLDQRIQITRGAAGAHELLRAGRQRTLTGPEDDMWATFADLAEPYSLTFEGQVIGHFSVDSERQLYGFGVRDDAEAMTTELFAGVIAELEVSAVITSTVDPILLSLALTAGDVVRPMALMYDHVAASEIEEPVDLRIAGSADHSAVVAFCREETGSSETFLVPYLAERIELGELFLLEADGRLVASGECRVDTRAPGNAHLGFVVRTASRGLGLGGRLLHTLAEQSRARDLIPRCSTEPTNLPARRAIRRAGFRSSHLVLRVAVSA